MAEIQPKQVEGLVRNSGQSEPVDLGSQNVTTTGTITAGNFVGPGGGGSVSSVNGETGAVVLDTDDIAEGITNLYFTDGRATSAVISGLDTDDITEGVTNLYSTTERIQDAVGAMINSTLVYTDGTPLLSRAAITGDISIGATSNVSVIANSVITNAKISASAAIDASKIADGTVSSTEFQYINSLTSNAQTQLNAKVNLTGNETIAGIKTFSSIPILPASDPTTSNEAVRKSYVDVIAQTVNPSLYKNSCTVATTVNITLSGEQTIDTFATSATRVLVWMQTAQAENGIYISDSGAWTRASDYNTAGEVLQGTSTFILDGSAHKNRLFVMNATSITTLGTDVITFTPLSGLNTYNSGNGVDVSGNTLSTNNTYLNANLSFIDKNGTVAADSIGTFYDTTGDIKDSAVKITTVTAFARAIQPTQAGYSLELMSAANTGSGNGATTYIRGGDTRQSGGTSYSGGSVAIYNGTGWNGDDLVTTPAVPLTWNGGSLTLLNNETGTASPAIVLRNSHSITTIASLLNGVSGSVYITGVGYISTDNEFALTDGATVSLPVYRSSIFSLTASGDRTILAPSSPYYTGKRIIIRHTASGANRTLSLTGGSGGFRFSADIPALTATASGTTDYIEALYNSTDIVWDVVGYRKGSATSPTASTVNALSTDIQTFTSSGTWTKPAGSPKFTQVIAIGGGGGGGSGRKGAVATIRGGGAGGGAGGWATGTFATSVLPSTVTVTVGTGGTGGASRTTNSTNGATGSNGGITSFGDFLRAGRGNGGAGGIAGASTGGNGGQIFPPASSAFTGASSSGSGAAGSQATPTGFTPAGGGSGGGITTGNVASLGGLGGNVGSVTSNNVSGYAAVIAGGTVGAISAAGGNGGASPTNSGVGGAGGGGGGSSITTNAGAGGNGGLYGGGGGGGGGATNDVGNSGDGGNGANGFCILITTY